jgi:divalent metal cation (Fe/Co/Zn/Cd) transporter
VTTADSRPRLLSHALRLEYLTVGWNVIEGVVAIAAAAASGSTALLGFGIDSAVETASGAILIWRLRAEDAAPDDEAIERLDRRAHRLVGVSLFALATWVALDAGLALRAREAPDASWVGIGLTSVSLVAMAWLARAKRAAAATLESRALAADSFQTSACFWLSLLALLGVGSNTLLGWWWADPLAALAMTPLFVREGRAAWRGEDCCDGAAPGALSRTGSGCDGAGGPCTSARLPGATASRRDPAR